MDGDELVERTGPLSSPELERYLGQEGIELAEGCEREVNLAALEWLRAAAGHVQKMPPKKAAGKKGSGRRP